MHEARPLMKLLYLCVVAKTNVWTNNWNYLVMFTVGISCWVIVKYYNCVLYISQSSWSQQQLCTFILCSLSASPWPDHVLKRSVYLNKKCSRKWLKLCLKFSLEMSSIQKTAMENTSTTTQTSVPHGRWVLLSSHRMTLHDCCCLCGYAFINLSFHFHFTCRLTKTVVYV